MSAPLKNQFNIDVDGAEICSALKQYLDNNPLTGNDTQYDWRNSLNSTNDLFSTLGEYIDVRY